VGATVVGHMVLLPAASAGQNVCSAGQFVGRTGHQVFCCGHSVLFTGQCVQKVPSGSGHSVSVYGQTVAAPERSGQTVGSRGSIHMVISAGQAVGATGHSVFAGGHCVTVPGHMVAWLPVQSVASNGHTVGLVVGQTVESCGHLVSSTGHCVGMGLAGSTQTVWYSGQIVCAKPEASGHLVGITGHLV
jgi:hypothetical protein